MSKEKPVSPDQQVQKGLDQILSGLGKMSFKDQGDHLATIRTALGNVERSKIRKKRSTVTPDMVLLTWNLGMTQDDSALERVAKVVSENGVTIFCAQEIFTNLKKGAADRHHCCNKILLALRARNSHWSVESMEAGRSKYNQMETTAVYYLSSKFAVTQSYHGCSLKFTRSPLILEMHTLSSDPVHFSLTNFHIRSNNSKSIRLDELSLIGKYTEGMLLSNETPHRYHFLIGDFNSEFSELTDLVCAQVCVNLIPSRPTTYACVAAKTYDYVLVRSNSIRGWNGTFITNEIDIDDSEVMMSSGPVSDHRPVAFEVAVRYS